ncbi:MAG: hypothetical protein R6U62_08015 [Bacteroidales bacterium]
MQKKLQELTEKIYQEGVNKANQEAEKIVSDAQKEADDLLDKANKDAEAIRKKAETEANELKNNSLNELKLAARQALSDLKQEIVNLIQAKTIEPETKAAFKEVEFTRDIIQTIVDKWEPEGSDNVNLTLLLPKERQKEFDSFFKNKAKKLLDSGLSLDYSEKFKGGFKIGPKEGGYLISFSDEDFDHFFKMYMRPRLIDLLFEDNKGQEKAEPKAKEDKKQEKKK